MNNVDLVKTGLTAWEHGDEATLAPLVADDFSLTGPVPQPVGKAEFLGLMHALHAAMPDFSFNASSFEEHGDTVIAHTRITATHTGTLHLPGFPPIPATGKKVSLPDELNTYTIKNGKVHTLVTDARPDAGIAGMLSQLGVPLP